LTVHGYDFVSVAFLVVADDKDHRPALECWHWADGGFWDVCIATLSFCCSPCSPVVSRVIYASTCWFQPPSGAELVAVAAEQIGDR
jgi:hypothetical protein